MNDKIKLPNGLEYTIHLAYSGKEAIGVTVLVVISFLSLIAVLGLLGALALSAFNTRSSLDDHLFVRTHVAAYFVCVLVCDVLQAFGSLFNMKWVHDMGVVAGPTCTAQGIFKQASDVGTAFWTLVIAIHTFCLLVLEMKLREFVLWTTLIAGWSMIAAIVIGGPAILDTDRRGPFHGISGYWCWITDGYKVERISSDYALMFSAAFFSFVLYSLIFLRLRGNFVIEGYRFYFRRIHSKNAQGWRGRQVDNQAMAVARQMLIYPVAYTLMILPIAVSRFMTWAGRTPPFEVTVFSAAVFLLSGLVNVVLFCSTRPVLPPQSLKIRMLKFRISQPTIIAPPQPPLPEANVASDSYYPSHHASDTEADPYYASHRAAEYDPYYSSHFTTGDEESLEEKIFSEKIEMPAPSLPASSINLKTSWEESSSPPNQRSPSPPGRVSKASRVAHLPEIHVPHRDSFTGATNMYKQQRDVEEYKEINLRSGDGPGR